MRAIAAVVLLVLAIPAVQASWPSFHNDERNTGFASGSEYKPYVDVWWSVKLKPNTQAEASPVVSGSTVIVASWDKKVRALDAESGAELWNVTMGSRIQGTPAIAGGRVHVVDTGGSLKALDLASGVELDSANVGSTEGHITIHEGKLYVGNEAGDLSAFDTASLTLLWKFSTNSISEGSTTTCTPATPPATPVCTTTCGPRIPSGAIRGAPAVYKGNVIFTSLNHYVYAVKENGNPGQTTDPQWWFRISPDSDIIPGSPMVDSTRDTVVVGSYAKKVVSMPVTPSGQGPVMTGTPPVLCAAFKNSATWTYTVPSDFGASHIYSSPASDGTRIFFGAQNGRVYALNAATGAKDWEFKTDNKVQSSPAVSNGHVVIGSDDGKVYWLNAVNGSKEQEFQTRAPIKASPAIDGNRAFVVSSEGDIYMFGPKLPPRPDLEVSAITANATHVSVTVRNAGDGAAIASTVRITADGSLVGDVTVPAIEPGQSATVDHRTNVTAAEHTFKAVADTNNVVKESKESNNELSQKLTIAPPPTTTEEAPPSQAPPPPVTTTAAKKKSPGAALGVLVTTLGAALLARRRRE